MFRNSKNPKSGEAKQKDIQRILHEISAKGTE